MALTQLKTGAIADDAVTEDKLANAINTARTANTAKTTNATHTGDVTGSGSLTIADNAVTLAKMAGGTDGQIITYDASGDPVAVGPGTDGQVLTSTGAGSPPAFETIPSSGKILQVVSATKTDTFTTTSTSPVGITGLSVSITPSSSSNKIFLIASIGAASTTTGDYSTFFYFYRGGSLITGTVGDTESSCTSAAFSLRASHVARHESTTGHFLDSPSSTSALTYQLYCSIESGGGTSCINRDAHSSQTSGGRPRNISSITVMEVAA